MMQHAHSDSFKFQQCSGKFDPLDRESLAAIAVHELREPLQAMLSFLTVVLQERAGPLTDVQRDFLSTADVACRRLKRRIEDVQLIISGEDGFSISLEPVDLLAHVQLCCHELAEITRSHNVDVEVVLPVEPEAWIIADPVRLDQILLNLIENAVQYASPQSTIRIVIQSSLSGTWCVAVENIVDEEPVEDPGSWFGAFERGRAERSLKRDGHGLGLTVVEYLVRAQGGHVLVNTTGRNVCFCVTFGHLTQIPQGN